MNQARQIFNFLIVTSTTLLVGVLAYENLSKIEMNTLENIALQVMHVALLIGTVLNVLHFKKAGNTRYLWLTAIPLIFLLLAFGGVYFDIRASSFSLLLFDFYLIFWFYFLLIKT